MREQDSPWSPWFISSLQLDAIPAEVHEEGCSVKHWVPAGILGPCTCALTFRPFARPFARALCRLRVSLFLEIVDARSRELVEFRRRTGYANRVGRDSRAPHAFDRQPAWGDCPGPGHTDEAPPCTCSRDSTSTPAGVD